jgi:hypothetical protein
MKGEEEGAVLQKGKEEKEGQY